jgi:PAS domain S-box-containing protein
MGDPAFHTPPTATDGTAPPPAPPPVLGRKRLLLLLALAQTMVLALAVLVMDAQPLALLGLVGLGVLTVGLAAGLGTEANALRQALTEARESESRYRHYSETNADWFWETDADHRYCWFSAQFAAVMNLPAAKLLGKRSWDVVSERMEIDSHQWQAHIADLSAQRPFRDFKFWLEEEGGRARWIKVSGMPLFNADGVFHGYRGTGADITQAVESAHRMNMLNRAVEQSPVSIVITDLKARIQYVNAEFLTITGYSLDEVIGQTPSILKSGHTQGDTYLAMWGALKAGEKWEGELINKRKNGELYWEHASIQPIQNIEGEISNYMAIKTDITRQKHDQSRMAELVEELRRSNEELEQFAYVASHDLRQPLRMINGYLGLLHKKLGAGLDKDSQDFFGFAIDGAKRLDSMIVDLLEYSRIGRLSQSLSPMELDSIVADAVHHLQMAIKDVGAEVSVDPGLPAVVGDRSELLRLFQNLVGNAIKYCDPNRPPKVRVFAADTGDEWVLSVQDNGIGIAPDDLQRVFGIFQRLVTRDNYEGTGIGLAVCRKIAEHHGGRIWVESEVDVGSTFKVAFPKA